MEARLPDVKFFASQLDLSPNYLSDLLHRYTGKTTHEHIHLKLVDTAKSLLWSTEKSISETAYELGFEYPSHFTKVFKTKTGLTPQQYMNTNLLRATQNMEIAKMQAGISHLQLLFFN